MSEDRARNNAGQFVATRSPDELLDAMEPLEPYSASELAEEIEWPYRTVHKILADLEAAGRVRKKKTGHRTVIWIRPSPRAST